MTAMEEIMGILPKPKKKYEKEDKDDSDQMVGHSTNRRLNEPYNIKARFTVEFFDDTFKFLRELGYNTLFRFDKKGIKIFKLDTSTTHFSYVIIDKTEMSEYYVDWKNTPPTVIEDSNTNDSNDSNEESYSDSVNESYNDDIQNDTQTYSNDNFNTEQESSPSEEQESSPSEEQESSPSEEQESSSLQPEEPSTQEQQTSIPDEVVVYLETDIIEDMAINNKYPVEMYFDTIDKNKYYIVNGKEIVSRRLNGLENNNNTVSMYATYYDKMRRWMTDDNTFKISVTPTGMKNVLTSLEKKKPKKDKSAGAASAFVEVKFSKNEIDFIVQDQIKSSSIQLYGDDIIVKSKQTTEAVYNLESFVKFSKLKLNNTITFHISERFPLILETKFGANRTILLYAVAPRSDAS